MINTKSIPDDKVLFDGVSLDHWQVIDYEGHGTISIADSCIIIGKGEFISGIRWTEYFPKTNYEVTLYAKRVMEMISLRNDIPGERIIFNSGAGRVGRISYVGSAALTGMMLQTISRGKIFYFGTGAWWLFV